MKHRQVAEPPERQQIRQVPINRDAYQLVNQERELTKPLSEWESETTAHRSVQAAIPKKHKRYKNLTSMLPAP